MFFECKGKHLKKGGEGQNSMSDPFFNVHVLQVEIYF